MRHWISHVHPIVAAPLILLLIIWPVFNPAGWIAAGWAFGMILAIMPSHYMHCRPDNKSGQQGG